jgi:hypothetical protein
VCCIVPAVEGGDWEPERLDRVSLRRDSCCGVRSDSPLRDLAATTRECSDEVPTIQEILARIARAKAAAR